MVLEQLDRYMDSYKDKHETGPFPHTKHKSHLQVDYLAKCKERKTGDFLKSNKREYLCILKVGQDILNRTQKA